MIIWVKCFLIGTFLGMYFLVNNFLVGIDKMWNLVFYVPRYMLESKENLTNISLYVKKTPKSNKFDVYYFS